MLGLLGDVVSFRYGKVMMHVLNRHRRLWLFLLRLAPIPFGVVNVVSGLSGNVAFGEFVVFTFLGLLPEQSLVVYLGHMTRESLPDSETPPDGEHIMLLALSSYWTLLKVALIVILLAGLSWIVGRSLRQVMRNQQHIEESELEMV